MDASTFWTPVSPPPGFSTRYYNANNLHTLPIQSMECPPSIPTILNPFDLEYAVSTNEFLSAGWEDGQRMHNLAMFVEKVECHQAPVGGGAQKPVTHVTLTNFTGIQVQLYCWEEPQGALSQIPMERCVLLQNLCVAKLGACKVGNLNFQLRFNGTSSWKELVRPSPGPTLDQIPLPPPPPPSPTAGAAAADIQRTSVVAAAAANPPAKIVAAEGGGSVKNGSGVARGRKRAGNLFTINYSHIINYSNILLYNTNFIKL
jgi:hypothetical protein